VRCLGVAGSITSPSRSGALVARALELLRADGAETTLLDLSQLPAEGLLGRRREPTVDEALALVSSVEALVLGTPIYRATYTGQLKSFFDLLPTDALVGRVAGFIATAAAPGHLLAIDHGLRPLVASLGGLGAARAVYVTNAELGEFPAGPLPEPVDAMVRALVEELAALVVGRGRAS
jgi:FMN reductase